MRSRNRLLFLITGLAVLILSVCGSSSAHTLVNAAEVPPSVNNTEGSEYAYPLFDTARVHTIEIYMSEDDRADQLADPKHKKKYKVDVVIDGEEIPNVAFNTKGNSSLYLPAYFGKDKFSYALNFAKYEKGRTFHGLKKLNLQNNISDGTLIKDYMAYWLFRRMGVNAPLASYVWLTVNGEDQGLYTAIEDVSESFLERIADGEGTIYKPEDADLELNDEEMARLLEGEVATHNNGRGADLVYKDDKEESYPDIFNNAETDDDPETRARVIAALKALSERKNLDQYLDTEEIIKYFAVQDYLVNYDSYTGPMLHNYYLYENNGRLAMLPWDYDNSFGSFPADALLDSIMDSKDVVNAGVDSPLGFIADEDRPMWSWILSDQAYLNEYHEALSELVNVIDSGEYKIEAERVYQSILPYLEEDPKAFFTPEESRKAYETLIAISDLRAESVDRQVNGQLATRSEDQNEEDKVDASGIAIEDMG